MNKEFDKDEPMKQKISFENIQEILNKKLGFELHLYYILKYSELNVYTNMNLIDEFAELVILTGLDILTLLDYLDRSSKPSFSRLVPKATVRQKTTNTSSE